ncbi:MAG: family 16 glycosylhydrolase [Phycisphaerales bacterium JB052]
MMHTKAPILLAAAVFCSPTIAQDAWQLQWSDEFDGTALNTDNWSYQTGTGTAYGLPAGWGNNELQYYTDSTANITVSDGTLKINAIEQRFNGRDYTSARIRSLYKQDFLYGRFEARMKLPSTPGIWPAFWMLPTNSPYGSWASSGEIDIMESVNYADRIYGTLHFGNNWPNNASDGPRLQDGTDFSQDFHTYRIDWDPDRITWYVDDIAYGSRPNTSWFSSAAPSNPSAPFDSEFHLLLNVAVGGNFPGNPDGSSTFPQTLEVDYVRVYERVQLPYSGQAHPVPGTIQAEDFDLGAQNQSYYDCDATNTGGEYRETGVDIEVASEEGYNISDMCQGEWLEYTVDVQTAGTYTLETRVASDRTGGAFRIERDGQDLTGTVFFLATFGWQNWTTVTTNLELEAGEQVLRFVNMGVADTQYNVNSFTFTLDGPTPCSEADLAEPFGELNFFDVSAFLSAYSAQDNAADINADGAFNFFDVSEFLTIYNAGCP